MPDKAANVATISTSVKFSQPGVDEVCPAVVEHAVRSPGPTVGVAREIPVDLDDGEVPPPGPIEFPSKTDFGPVHELSARAAMAVDVGPGQVFAGVFRLRQRSSREHRSRINLGLLKARRV